MPKMFAPSTCYVEGTQEYAVVQRHQAVGLDIAGKFAAFHFKALICPLIILYNPEIYTLSAENGCRALSLEEVKHVKFSRQLYIINENSNECER